MFRQIIVFLSVFMLGVIANENFFISGDENGEAFNVEINGDLSINSTSNTNDEIAHQHINYEQLQLVKSVNGVLHYSIGARISSK